MCSSVDIIAFCGIMLELIINAPAVPFKIRRVVNLLSLRRGYRQKETRRPSPLGLGVGKVFDFTPRSVMFDLVCACVSFKAVGCDAIA